MSKQEHPTTPLPGGDRAPQQKSLLPDVAPPKKDRPDALVDNLLGVQLGNYEICFVLGKGAYGTVYKARDVKLGRFVAIKFLHEFLDATHEAMFLAEAKAIASLGKHSSIVQIFEWSEYEGRNYFVLEFVGSNAEMLLRLNPSGLSLEQAANIVVDCAEGLAYAHQQGIIHQDIKPANILLEIEGGRAKLADFGVARLFDATNDKSSGQIGGTPGYMAPELCAGKSSDIRSDIFSLGVTFYELLSNRIPYEGADTEGILELTRSDKGIALRTLKKDLPESIYAVIEKATAYDPDQRYSSADAFAEAVRSILEKPAQNPEAVAPSQDTGTKEDAYAAKIKSYKACEEAKRTGAEKLANKLLKKGVEGFRDAEAYERIRQYGGAIKKYEEAYELFQQAERRANQIMGAIRSLKVAQRSMAKARSEADAIDAGRFATATYALAYEKEQAARNTSGLTEAMRRYTKARELYEAATLEARQQGETALVEPRRTVEELRRKARQCNANSYAFEEMKAAQLFVEQAEAALPAFKQAKRFYLSAVEGFQEALRVTEERKRLEQEKEDRNPISIAGIEFIWIPPGSFLMGSEAGLKDELPAHEVTVSHGFWIGRFPVTQGQWLEIMGENPSGFKGEASLPVENVSWEDCQKFFEKLNAMDAGIFRFPTEAEWEYACRAGSTGAWCFGDDAAQLDSYAWNHHNAAGRTHPVGQKAPNAWGLHDVHGNVCEWCEDDWFPNHEGAPDDAAARVSEDILERVTRGGSWCIVTPDCRSASRGWYAAADTRTDFMGLRVCREKSD